MSLVQNLSGTTKCKDEVHARGEVKARTEIRDTIYLRLEAAPSRNMRKEDANNAHVVMSTKHFGISLEAVAS